MVPLACENLSIESVTRGSRNTNRDYAVCEMTCSSSSPYTYSSGHCRLEEEAWMRPEDDFFGARDRGSTQYVIRAFENF